MSDLYPVPLAIATYLGCSGYNKGSLSPTGALTASLVGYATMANPFLGYGLTLITFYLTGSRATKFKASIKASLETHSPTDSISVEKKRDISSGNRSATQVLCNSLTAMIAALAFRVYNSGVTGPDPMGKATVGVAGGVGVSNALLTLVIGGHFGACMGDTLASELGILSNSSPRLITAPWRRVPKGTNGGVTLLGLSVSALGGTLIGLVTSLSLALHYYWYPSPNNNLGTYAKITALLTVSGLFGSLLDSVLGATLQQTLYNKGSGKVLVGQITDVLDGKKQDDPNVSWERITGANVLSNNGVNFVASGVCAILTAVVGVRWL